MTALNGTSAPTAPPDPRETVAEAVYTAMMDEGDPPYAELEPEDRADILHLTGNYLTAHLNFLNANGFRIVPLGAVLTPHTEAEALAMVKAAKDYFDAAKRKGKLMGAAVEKPKLILPPGMH
jgi:hypothetical protein